MRLIRATLARTICVTCFLLGALPAWANTYDVTFTGSSLDLSAVITTGNAIDPKIGGFDILSMTGTVTAMKAGVSGGAITGLIANPNQPYQGLYTDNSTGLSWYYDNILFKGSIPFDNNGPLFKLANGIVGNLYSVGPTFYLSVSRPISLFDPGETGTLQVSQVPLPAALPLFAFGLGAIGIAGWRKKRKTFSPRPA